VGEAGHKVNALNGRWRALLALSAALAVVASALLLVALHTPVLVFRGSVEGYISLSGYRVFYFGDELRSAVLDRAVLTAKALYIPVALGLLSPAFLLLYRRWPGASVALIAGSAMSLPPGYGLLKGLAGLVNTYSSIALSIAPRASTTAGSITYMGQVVGTGLAGHIASSPAPWALSAAAVALAAAVLAYLEGSDPVYYLRRAASAASRIPRVFGLWLRASAVLAAIAASMVSLASVSVYYPSTISMSPVYPPAQLQPPPYGYTCTQIQRTSRGAIAYTDFETLPPGFASRGGIWGIAADQGYRGNALQGQDNNGGTGGASQYYNNTRLDTTYSSLWASVKVRLVSGADGYRGLAFLNPARDRLYEVSIYNGYLYIRSYRVSSPNTWANDNLSIISGYSAGSWYTIVAYYSVSGNTITIYAWAYDVNGNLVASTSATISGRRVFNPAYIGLEVDGSGTVYYDDFVVSTADPRVVGFSGLQAGMSVEIVDNLGNLVASGSPPLSVVSDIVVGTGSGGTIRARYPDSSQCISYAVPTSDAIVGGDSYALSTSPISYSIGPAGASASITAYISPSQSYTSSFNALRLYTSQGLYARLLLSSISSPSTLYASITVSTATATSAPVQVVGGTPATTSTSIVYVPAGGYAYINVTGYFTSASQAATLNILLELCTQAGGQGACAYYPITLSLRS